MQIDRRYTLETLARLVQINSINPTLAPGAPGESEIAGVHRRVAARLRADGGDRSNPSPGGPACWAAYRERAAAAA